MNDNEFLISREREKRNAALTSVIAAIGLTAIKIIVGVFTGSLVFLQKLPIQGLTL